jgi:hypothetical protein
METNELIRTISRYDTLKDTDDPWLSAVKSHPDISEEEFVLFRSLIYPKELRKLKGEVNVKIWKLSEQGAFDTPEVIAYFREKAEEQECIDNMSLDELFEEFANVIEQAANSGTEIHVIGFEDE